MPNAQPSHASERDPAGDLPHAIPVRRRRLGLGWLLPLVGLGLLGYFTYWAYEQQRFNVELIVADATGIKAFQTPVLCRGVEVGGVTAVTLHAGGRGASVQLRLEPSGLALATADADWWVTRPELTLTAVRDVESLLAGPSVQFRPGVELPAKRFTALPGPPADAGIQDGLRLVLRSPDRGAVRPGTPLRYRGVSIGRVVSLRLPRNGQSVLVVAEVDRPYAHLVRDNSRFWHRELAQVSVSRVSLGLGGYKVELPRLNSALDLSIDLGVPDAAGPPVSDDSVFVLEAAPPENHRDWRPDLGVGAGAAGITGLAAGSAPDDGVEARIDELVQRAEAAEAAESEKQKKKRGPIEGLFDLIVPFN